MSFPIIFAIAIKAILTNKVRSFLTMLGVIIGVASVVLLTSIGTGLQAFVSDQFAALGSNTLFVVPGNPFGESGGLADGEQAFIASTKPTLREEDLRKVLRDDREFISDGLVTGFGVAEAKYSNTSKKVTLYGVTANYGDVQNTKAVEGQWFTDTDNDRAKRVAVLGPEIAKQLFGEVDPINKSIRLEGQSYQILGVLEKKGGGFGGPSFDNYVYIPWRTLQDQFNIQLVDSFVLEVQEGIPIDVAKERVKQTISKRLKEKDSFTVFDQTQLLSTITSIIGVLNAGLGGIAAISLVVGGIGIMNIMLVSVTERTREIGLRKALGATPNLILVQFLIEAALLSGIGGLIGVGLAFLGTIPIQAFFPAKILPSSIAVAFGVSTAVGLIFGAAPARAASKLSPIEALRSE
jgi:putative ABC transport system permease protein